MPNPFTSREVLTSAAMNDLVTPPSGRLYDNVNTQVFPAGTPTAFTLGSVDRLAGASAAMTATGSNSKLVIPKSGLYLLTARAIFNASYTQLLTAQDQSLESAGLGTWIASSSSFATLTNSTAQAYSGTHSLLATIGSAGSGNLYTGQYAVTPGAYYSVTLANYRTAILSFAYYITPGIDWFDSTHTYISTSTDQFYAPAPTTWTSVYNNSNHQAPSNAAYARVNLAITGVAGMLSYVDSVLLNPAAPFQVSITNNGTEVATNVVQPDNHTQRNTAIVRAAVWCAAGDNIALSGSAAYGGVSLISSGVAKAGTILSATRISQ